MVNTINLIIMRKYIWILALVMALISCGKETINSKLNSPDGKVQLSCGVDGNGQPYYVVTLNGKMVVDTSLLGIQARQGDFSKGLALRP